MYKVLIQIFKTAVSWINKNIKNPVWRVVTGILIIGIISSAIIIISLYTNKKSFGKIVKQNQEFNIKAETVNIGQIGQSQEESENAQESKKQSEKEKLINKEKNVKEEKGVSQMPSSPTSSTIRPPEKMASTLTRADEKQTPEKQIEVVSTTPQVSDRYYIIETWQRKVIESDDLYFLTWQEEKLDYGDRLRGKEPDYTEKALYSEFRFQSSEYDGAGEFVPFSNIEKIIFSGGAKEQTQFYFEVLLKNGKKSKGYIIVPKGKESWRFTSRETGTKIAMGCWQMKTITFPKRSW